MSETGPDDLIRLANQQMPFGKFKGRCLVDVPEEYLLWFSKRGFPAGKLGELMGLMLEIRVNGLEHLVRPLKHQGNRFEDRGA
ncbi:MAG: DUF3820 family protein [Proteobacteria bacterium]|jgi:uncharacterized protein (DUF3820 family)|nr:DUF3820 family protein [Pseudomonadota bacterium]MDA1300114.1 DUF3820 family protein [Pseudomonadota bacterium]